jgi:uncharacterized protein YhhL (DUF1145 family)
VLFVAALASALVFPAFKSAFIALLALGSAVIAIHSIELLLAKAGVLKKGEQPILYGQMQLIAWDPTLARSS